MVSTSVTRVARRAWRQPRGVALSVSAGFGAEGTGREDGGGSGRSASGAPTLESWPYHLLRSFGPPSMTSSILVEQALLSGVGHGRRAARRGVATGGDGRARRSRRDGGAGVPPRRDAQRRGANTREA